MAAILGAVFGALFATVGTFAQIHATQNDQLNNFVRTQRMTAYTTFLNSAQDLGDQGSDLEAGGTLGFSFSSDAVQSDLHDLSTGNAALRLIASRAVFLDASAVYVDALNLSEQELGPGAKPSDGLTRYLNNYFRDLNKCADDMQKDLVGQNLHLVKPPK